MNRTSLKFGVSVLFLSQLIAIVSGYLVNIFLSRVLGPEDYGKYSIVFSFISIVNIVLSSSIPQAISKFISEKEADKEKIKSDGVYLQSWLIFLTFIIVFVFSRSISLIIGDENLSNLIRISSITIPLYGFYIFSERVLNGLRMFDKQSVINSIFAISKLLLAIFLLKIENNLNFAILAATISPFIPMVMGLFFTKPKIISFKKNVQLKKYLNFSLPFFTFSILTNISLNSGFFFLNHFSAEKDLVGYYSAAFRITQIIGYLPTTISVAIFPAISNSFSSSNLFLTKKYIKKSFLLILASIIPIIIFFYLFREALIKILFGAEYINAMQVLTPLSVGVGLFFAYNHLLTIISSIKRQLLSMKISIITFFISILSNLILIPKYQMIGTAYSVIIFSSLGIVIGLIFMYNQKANK